MFQGSLMCCFIASVKCCECQSCSARPWQPTKIAVIFLRRRPTRSRVAIKGNQGGHWSHISTTPVRTSQHSSWRHASPEADIFVDWLAVGVESRFMPGSNQLWEKLSDLSVRVWNQARVPLIWIKLHFPASRDCVLLSHPEMLGCEALNSLLPVSVCDLLSYNNPTTTVTQLPSFLLNSYLFPL